MPRSRLGELTPGCAPILAGSQSMAFRRLIPILIPVRFQKQRQTGTARSEHGKSSLWIRGNGGVAAASSGWRSGGGNFSGEARLSVTNSHQAGAWISAPCQALNSLTCGRRAAIREPPKASWRLSGVQPPPFIQLLTPVAPAGLIVLIVAWETFRERIIFKRTWRR
jgi:hypothetical protein